MNFAIRRILPVLISVIAFSGAQVAIATSALPATKPKRVACVALVDVTAPSGTPVPITSYKQQVLAFFNSCVADHALMQVLPLLDAQGTIDPKFPTATSDRLVDSSPCIKLLAKAEHDNSASETTNAQNCIMKVAAADGAVTSFMNNLTLANVDQTRSTTEILTPIVSAAGILANSGATKKHLLVLSPGFQTAGTDINFNANGAISTASAPSLVAQAMSGGFVPSLRGVDVHLAGIGTLNRPIDPSYLEGTRAFWTDYLQAAGVPNPSSALVVVYTPANYQR